MSLIDNSKKIIDDTVFIVYKLYTESGKDISKRYHAFFDLAKEQDRMEVPNFRSCVLASNDVPPHIIETKWCQNPDNSTTRYYHHGQPTEYSTEIHPRFLKRVLAELQPRYTD